MSELNEEALERAKSYLAQVTERLQSRAQEHKLSITSSVKLEKDVASALMDAAEQEDPGGCDLIAISTHGWHGLQRWVMGSITERILNTSRLPILIVRPQQ